jgi:hypothetical protein
MQATIKTILFTGVMLFTCNALVGCIGTTIVKEFNPEMGKGVAVDSAGNAYVVGEFYGPTDFDPGPGVELLGGGYSEAFLSKFGPNGDRVWTRVWGLDSTQYNNIRLDNIATYGGNVFVTGEFSHAADLDPGPGVDEHTPNFSPDVYLSKEWPDVFFSKLDSDGNFLWARVLGGPSWDEIMGVTIDSNGNIYLCGKFWTTVDFDPGPGMQERTANGYVPGDELTNQPDIFVSKFDSQGDFLWVRTWGGDKYDYALKMAVDSEGNTLIWGTFSGIVDFDPGPGVDEHTSRSPLDCFLSKLDSEGNFLWVRTWPGGNLKYAPKPTDVWVHNERNGWVGPECGLAVDGRGNTQISGMLYGSVDLDPGSGVEIHVEDDGMCAFLCQLDPSGNFLWARSWGFASSCEATIDDGGNVWLSGIFLGSTDFDPGAGVDEHTSNGDQDIYLSKLDSTGNFLWARTWGGAGKDEINSVAIDDADDAYATGCFLGTVDFDPGTGVDEHTSLGESDMFLSKFDSTGNFLWARTWGGDNPMTVRRVSGIDRKLGALHKLSESPGVLVSVLEESALRRGGSRF